MKIDMNLFNKELPAFEEYLKGFYEKAFKAGYEFGYKKGLAVNLTNVPLQEKENMEHSFDPTLKLGDEVMINWVDEEPSKAVVLYPSWESRTCFCILLDGTMTDGIPMSYISKIRKK